MCEFWNTWGVAIIGLTGTILGILIGHFLGLRKSRVERSEEREVRSKDEAKLRVKKWAEDCLQCLNEIAINIQTTEPPVKCDPIYRDLMRLRPSGISALSDASFLGNDIRNKTVNAFTDLQEAITASKMRDENIFNIFPKMESNLKDLIDSLSR